ncbi:hypothetical protein IE53DRAFT_386791 [Violaceomyces palustris]|uniref:Uncharacterized protein n=1 Tax=Violaceomyces palustris TaxID=1673888 RepID=A0ACD0NYI8_9BASI|nr:hypothetical protein IE53DRAFT_386791 [Violaceomyces palustris]
MGPDGGEAGRRLAAEDEYIRRELSDTTDFCNAFWGSNDAGYDVIQARMKMANRTLDELRALYKERADIEADYSKRLARLSKVSLGRDETGYLRAALEVVRMELDATSKTHSDLSNMIKKDLEGNVTEFQSRTAQVKKSNQVSIEKLYKNKQTQEQYVNKSREKYEQDCIKINGYTAQSSLVQGRDLDKVAYKLDKAQATVASNDKDYQNFVRALKDTTVRWNAEWKSYLDQCQDLEEERLDFMKSNLWNYANAVSAVCVADDESCERVRVALENCETPRDIQAFIQQSGTGPLIPAPPEYINYAKGQPPPARPSFHTARFQRNSTRPAPLPISQPLSAAPPPPPANGQTIAPSKPTTPAPAEASRSRKSSSGGDQFGSQIPRPESRAGPPPPNAGDLGMGAPPVSSFKPPPGSVGLPGMTSPSKAASTPIQDVQPDVDAIMQKPTPERRMSARNFMARTPSMSQSKGHQSRGTVDLGRGGNPLAEAASVQTQPDLQQSQQKNASRIPFSQSQPTTSSGPPPEEEDPIAKALASLRMRPGGRSPGPNSPATGPGRRTSVYDGSTQQQTAHRAPSPAIGSVFQPPQHQQVQQQVPSPSISQQTIGRARSPSAAFMQAPQRAASPLPVEDVVGHYGQSFPGERKTLSRQNSTASRQNVPPSPSHNHANRPRSPMPGEQGFAGVGAGARSPSPQPYAKHQQQGVDDPRRRSGAASVASGMAPPRSTTPLGIALDATGSVTHDQMAEDYLRRAGSVPPIQAAPPQSFQQQQGYHQSTQVVQHGQQIQRPGSTAPPSTSHQPATSVYHQQSSHQSQPTMMSQFGGAQQQQQQQPPPSMSNNHYSYQGSISQGQRPAYAQQQQHQPPLAASPHQQQQQHQHQPSVYGPPSATQTQTPQPGVDARTYGGYMSPAPYGQSPGPPPTQSLHGNLTQPQNHPHAGMTSPAPHGYQQQPSQQAYYGHPQQQQPPPQQETPAAAYMHQYQQQQQQQQVLTGAHSAQPSTVSVATQHGQWGQAQHYQSGVLRGASPAPVQQQPPTPQNHQVQVGAQPGQAPGPNAQGQPHPPTGQFSDSGKPILFYVKALYDYSATMEEEFSFTAGDIIAVTHTEADGWWQGELLDEARRRPGANTFPSNFVVLLM